MGWNAGHDPVRTNTWEHLILDVVTRAAAESACAGLLERTRHQTT